MARIEGFRVRNFGVLKDVTIGKLWDTEGVQPLTPLTAVIGKNGVGKTTLFKAFGFLSECVKYGLEEACNRLGGFERIRSQGNTGQIEFFTQYRHESSELPITYFLKIELDEVGRPYVSEEQLTHLKKEPNNIHPTYFMSLSNGKYFVMRDVLEGEVAGKDWNGKSYRSKHDVIEIEDKRKLGIATIGSLKNYPVVSAFKQFIEGWYLSYFNPAAARSLPPAGPQRHLNVSGDNIGNVVQYMEREHKGRFKHILESIADKIPDIDKIETQETIDGRLLLRFNEKAFKDPFYAWQMSDGTLKIFAYMLLLNDPTPPPFICIEEPENGLYHKLLETLANEFRERATGEKNTSQVFITTHQPYFINALSPEEVWVMTKGEDGFASVKRASDDELVRNLCDEALPLGGLWYSDYLDPR
ncbi:AAA family ATPase [Candidatus Magnetominusculus dajiuhuensis]|uniref:AAA family ATPase n=1 Tax=Candidatus Magnetominusculus dajiuhuensis TaxID=3137712 RepID=UPI003B42DE52